MATDTATNTPDPGALSPSWGVSNALWIAYTAYSSDSAVTGYPANYTDGTWTQSNANASSSAAHTVSAVRELNAATENPGNFTLSNVSGHVANTIAIRPCAPTGGGGSQDAGDTTAPSVSFTSPSSGATVSGSSVSVTATASDNVGVSSVQFKIGSSVIFTDTSSPYAATLNTTQYSNGAYTLSAIATDAAGNEATTTRGITISNATSEPPPQADTSGCFADAGTAAGSNIQVSVTPTRISGVAPLSVFFDASGTTAQATSRPFHDLAYCWDFDDSGGGNFLADGKSKNRAYGPEAAHVFETPGNYSVSLKVRDSQGRVASKNVQIGVSDPNAFFAGISTVSRLWRS